MPALARGGPRYGDAMLAGDNLRAWRMSRGLTQKQVADEVGTSQGVVSSWETERRRPIGLYAENLRELIGISAAKAGSGTSTMPDGPQ